MFSRRDCLTAVSTSLTLGVLAGHAGAVPVTPRAMIRLLKPGEAPQPCALTNLKWMEGSWIGQMPFGPVELVNLPIAAGHLPGFVRATNADGVVFYEVCLYAQVGASLIQRVKHFTPSLEGWEARENHIDRPLVEREGDTFFFDGITIVRSGPDSYTVYFLDRDGEKERDTIVVPFRRKS
jgi:hypothetical protein